MEAFTYQDIAIIKLEGLQISELRELAVSLFIVLPLSKTQDELMTEIQKIVEIEMNYYSPPPL